MVQFTDYVRRPRRPAQIVDPQRLEAKMQATEAAIAETIMHTIIQAGYISGRRLG